MKVKELAQEIEICALDDTLKKIAGIMIRHDFDAVPIADKENNIVGVVTPNDICAAAARFDRKTSAIKNREVAAEEILICDPQERFDKLLKKMTKRRIKYAGFSSQKGQTIAIISLPKILSRLTDDKKVIKKTFRAMGKISKPLPLVLSEVGFTPKNK